MNTPQTPIKFRYKNHEGKTRVREAVIRRVYFGSTEWHPDTQWMIEAYCMDHKEKRDFALKDCDFSSFAEDA